MGECKLDHSLDDVRKKLAEQSAFLPAELSTQLSAFLREDRSQQQLNELFHLLKKYDLADDAVRVEREAKMRAMISGPSGSVKTG